MSCPICKSRGDIFQSLCRNINILGSCFPKDVEINLAYCSSCGLVYQSSSLAQSNFSLYYETVAKAPSYYSLFGKEESDSYFEHIYQIISKYLKSDRNQILDVAGSWGELASFIKKINKNCQVTVMDISAVCLEDCKKKGLKIWKTDIASPDLKLSETFIPNYYDVIIINHTLEHIVDLRTTMKNVGRMLKDDGIVFVEVPDANRYSMEQTPPYFFATLEHVSHFTSSSLEKLSVLSGFYIIEKGEYYKEVSKYPSLWAVLRKNNVLDIHEKFAKYIKLSNITRKKSLSDYEKTQQSIVLWGLGASTILELECFSNCNVVALVDSNPYKQKITVKIGRGGEQFHISSPEILLKLGSEPIIFVLTEIYKDAIKEQIKSMGLKNQVVSW